MCNNCGCNREFGFNEVHSCGCGRSDWNNNCGCGCNNDFNNDSAALYEAELIARAALRRRCRENRCAREFVRCMKNARCGF